jgi:hypothetical protein
MPLVILAEGTWLYQSLTGAGHRAGYVDFLQADWEAKQGLHFVITGETKNDGGIGEDASFGARASAVWFFAPHADLRLDDVFRRVGRSGGIDELSWFATLHLYL